MHFKGRNITEKEDNIYKKKRERISRKKEKKPSHSPYNLLNFLFLFLFSFNVSNLPPLRNHWPSQQPPSSQRMPFEKPTS